MKNLLKTAKGFTLLELLVVVLIIGILASIALPQYQMAVTKAKVASILPLMRRWKDALQEYKLQHGDYEIEDASALGVSWPNDWDDCKEEDIECDSDYLHCCANCMEDGNVYCSHNTNDDGTFYIYMYQPDDPNCEVCRDKIMCFAFGEESNKICKALGGKPVETDFGSDYSYSL